MDGGEGEQSRRGQRDGTPGRPIGDLEEPEQAGDDERRRPGEVRDGDDRVPPAELGEVEVERLDLAAEDLRVARRLREEAGPGSQDDEDQAQIPELGWEQAPTETVDRQHERERARNPGQVIGGDQREMEQGGKVAEEEVETEQKDAGVWFARVGIGPQP